MRGLGRVKECLRHLVDAEIWEYCVVWRLGDDPSSGSVDDGNVKVKMETEKLDFLCRDDHSVHPMRTRACELLSQFPLSLPLYSGMHGEVVMSKSPMWINHSGGFGYKTQNELMGTRVLIPVLDGLIEMFSSKEMPPDQKVIQLVMSHCDICLGSAQLISNAQSSTHQDPLMLELDPLMKHLSSVSRSNSAHLSCDGSSGVSNPSSENPSSASNFCQASQDTPFAESCSSKRLICSGSLLNQRKIGLVSDHSNQSSAKTIGKDNQNFGRVYRSKNLVTERNRRNRINSSILALRSMVPNISKMDKAATLGDAIEYIKKLQREAAQLQDELKVIDEEENKMNVAETLTRQDGIKEDESFKMKLEVNQISKREFLIWITCENKRSSFRKLMEAMHFLELEVVDANVTTFSGRTRNIMNVKAGRDNLLAGGLREALIELVTPK